MEGGQVGLDVVSAASWIAEAPGNLSGEWGAQNVACKLWWLRS